MSSKVSCEIFIRSVLFNVLCFFTIFCATVILYPIAFLPPRYVKKYWFGLAAVLVSFIENVAGIKCKVEGIENLKNNNVIYASRHESMWETIYLVFLARHGVFVLKKELTDIPFFGRFLKRIGMISIDRSKGARSIVKILKDSETALKNGDPIIIFPEGTRSFPANEFIPKKGICAMYERLNVDVIPIALNSGDFWKRRGFLKFPGTVTLRLLPPIHPGLSKDDFMKNLSEVINKAEKEIHC